MVGSYRRFAQDHGLRLDGSTEENLCSVNGAWQGIWIEIKLLAHELDVYDAGGGARRNRSRRPSSSRP